LQVITWIAEVAKKYSTISIPGVCSSGYEQFPLGLLFNPTSWVSDCKISIRRIRDNDIVKIDGT
jgi:hypothetical protein